MMTEEQFAELLNRELDGLNSRQESEELKAYVQTNAEARELYQDLLKLSTVLNRVEEVEPSGFLKADIMEAVRASRNAARSESSLLAWVREFIESRTSFQYAYVFAAGLIVGIAIYSLVGVHPTTSGVVDPADVSGSIIINDAAYPFTAGPGFEFNNETESISGSVRSKYSRNIAVVEVSLRTRVETAIVVHFDPSSVRFKGYSQSLPGTSVQQIEEKLFRVTTQDENHYILAFERVSQVPSEVTVSIASGGRELQQKSVLLGELGK